MTDDNERRHGDDPEGTEKSGGVGPDGTIPPDEDGVAVGLTDEPSHFNQEEDEEAPE